MERVCRPQSLGGAEDRPAPRLAASKRIRHGNACAAVLESNHLPSLRAGGQALNKTAKEEQRTGKHRA